GPRCAASVYAIPGDALGDWSTRAAQVGGEPRDGADPAGPARNGAGQPSEASAPPSSTRVKVPSPLLSSRSSVTSSSSKVTLPRVPAGQSPPAGDAATESASQC